MDGLQDLEVNMLETPLVTEETVAQLEEEVFEAVSDIGSLGQDDTEDVERNVQALLLQQAEEAEALAE